MRVNGHWYYFYSLFIHSAKVQAIQLPPAWTQSLIGRAVISSTLRWRLWMDLRAQDLLYPGMLYLYGCHKCSPWVKCRVYVLLFCCHITKPIHVVHLSRDVDCNSTTATVCFMYNGNNCKVSFHPSYYTHHSWKSSSHYILFPLNVMLQ